MQPPPFYFSLTMRLAEEAHLFTDQKTEPQRGIGLSSSLLRTGASSSELCFPSKSGVRERGREDEAGSP